MKLNSERIICMHCKKEIPSDSEFCQYCGGKIETLNQEENISIGKDVALEFLAASILESHNTKKANREAQPNNEDDAEFGLVPYKPIYTVDIFAQEKYLKMLRTMQGETIKWKRRGSMCVEGINGMVDVYDTYLPSGEEYKTIYINMYGAKDSSKAPKGYVLFIEDEGENAPLIMEKSNISKKQKDNKPAKRKKILCAILIPVGIVLGVVFVLLMIPGIKYGHANSLMEKGKYNEAYSEFQKLDGVFNSEMMMLECEYRKAVEYRENGSYALANIIFEALGDYKDSKALIHEHTYRLTSNIKATCTSAGEKIYECWECGDSYKDVVNASHKFVLIESVQATCSTTGIKQYKCEVCNETLSETIRKNEHDYIAATCTEPKKCATCGVVEGEALGHSKNVVECYRCGKLLFNTLTYTGTGSKVIKNIVTPNSKFVLSGYAVKTNDWIGSFYVYLNDEDGDRVGYWIETLYSGNKSMEKAFTFEGSLNGGMLEVQADDNISWTITIEAIRN